MSLKLESYVERIARNNVSSPFLQLLSHGVSDIRRLPKYNSFKIGDLVLLKPEDEKKIKSWHWGCIDYIVEIITRCEISDKTVFFLNNYNRTLLGLMMVLDESRIINPQQIQLEEKTILLSECVGSYRTFDGYDVGDVDVHNILYHNISSEDKLGELKYDVYLPRFVSNIDTSKISREKHVSNMEQLNSDEMNELRNRGFDIVFAKHVRY